MTDERWPRVKALFQAAVERPGDERATIDAAVASLRTARAGEDRDAIRERTTEVNHATEGLAERMMDAALKGALVTRRADQIMESS